MKGLALVMLVMLAACSTDTSRQPVPRSSAITTVRDSATPSTTYHIAETTVPTFEPETGDNAMSIGVTDSVTIVVVDLEGDE